MANNDNNKVTSSDSGEKKKITLPKVDPKKVKQLNEGADPKKKSRKDY